jgi:hypothetical protein
MLLSELTELNQVKQAVAVISTCIADALAEINPAFKNQFVANLDRAYTTLRDKGGTGMNPTAVHDLELISWTRMMVTGFSVSTDQGKTFFEEGEAPEQNLVRFRVEYADGTVAVITIDKWTLDRGDHVSRRIAVERQDKGEIPKGEITSVKRM